MRFGYLLVLVAVLAACSEFECPDGQARVDGVCLPSALGSDAWEPKTKTLPVACSNYPGDGYGWTEWVLTVDPAAIRSGELFGVEFEAVAVFPEYYVKSAQGLLGGVSRVELLDLRATVRVRRGVEDAEPVLLTFDRASIPWTCRYDENGNEVSEGDFPACDADNDNPDGSNDDCMGLGDAPDPGNRCGQFVDLPISTDCALGGVCDTVEYASAGAGPTAQELCEANGFCVTGPVEIPLTGSVEGYMAAEAGHVLFGWDDIGTGAELDETGGANHGTWILPKADFDNFEAPNGVRMIGRDSEVALACTLAAVGQGLFGVNSRDDLPAPAPDQMLISFPIAEPEASPPD